MGLSHPGLAVTFWSVFIALRKQRNASFPWHRAELSGIFWCAR